MERKLIYHVDRRGLFDQLIQGDRIQVCTLDNPYYSSLLAGYKVSYHGYYYLNQTGIGCNDPNVRSNALWELFAEMVRLKAFPQYGSRYNAMFGFENPEDLKPFIGFHNIPELSERKVFVLEVTDYLQRDMAQLASESNRVLEEDPNTYPDNIFIKHCYDYWAGNATKNPIIETLIYREAIVNEVIKVREFMSGTDKLI